MQDQINTATEILKQGGIILYPTDTIWGIGCDATNEEAVKRIYKLKKRSDSKSLIVLVDNDVRLQRTVAEVPEVAWNIMDYSKKPVTIIYDNPKGIAKSAVNNDDSLGIRVVKDTFCKKLISKLNKPIISTSANISGEKQANCLQRFLKRLRILLIIL